VDDDGDDTVTAVMVWDQGGWFYPPLALDARMKVFGGPTHIGPRFFMSLSGQYHTGAT
jgi:hypothetical protein